MKKAGEMFPADKSSHDQASPEKFLIA